MPICQQNKKEDERGNESENLVIKLLFYSTSHIIATGMGKTNGHGRGALRKIISLDNGFCSEMSFLPRLSIIVPDKIELASSTMKSAFFSGAFLSTPRCDVSAPLTNEATLIV